jgi:hypothetical protein
MSSPTLLLGFILSTLYGVFFHFWRGGGIGRLIFYVLLSWAGFWIGHFIASYFGWTIDKFGELHIGIATIGSILFLGAGYWLSLIEVEQKAPKK